MFKSVCDGGSFVMKAGHLSIDDAYFLVDLKLEIGNDLMLF